MSIQTSFLLELIGEKEYRFTGSTSDSIYEVQVLPPGTSPSSDSGILYLADLLDHHAFSDSSKNILFISKAYFKKCFSMITSVLSDDYRRNASFTRFCDGLLSELPLSNLVNIAHEVMQNPVWFIDKNFQILSYSFPGKRRILFPDVLRRKTERLDHNPIIIQKNENFSTRHLLAPVYANDETIGYLLVFETEHTFSDQLDLKYAKQLCSLMGKYISSDSFLHHPSLTEQFIIRILQKTLDSGAIEQQIQNLKFQESPQYYLLVIEQGKEHSSIYIKNELKKALCQDVFELDNHYLVLIGCDACASFTDRSFPDLNVLLKKYDMFCGLSNGFFQLLSLPEAYRQGQKAIQLRKRVRNNKYHFARYEDLIFTHLLDIANENGFSVFSFCHPNIISIWEYDKEHGTEYLETIGAYVYNYCNLQQTADALFIHRNTAYHRINLIKDLFQIDFDNPRLFMKLRISVTIFTYLNILDGIKLLGQLH